MIDNFENTLDNLTLLPSNDGQWLHVTAGDPGGATDMGITLPSLAMFLNKSSVTLGDLERVAADPVQRAAFYRTGYWRPTNCDALPLGVDSMVMDFGVVDGPLTSGRCLQQALGFSGKNVDGDVGPQTLAAVGMVQPLRVITLLARAQYAHIDGLNPTFQNGWRNRVARALGFATALCGPLGAGAASPMPKVAAVTAPAELTADELDDKYNTGA